MDLTIRPAGKWIVDFGWTMSDADAALYEAPFRWVMGKIAALLGEKSHVHFVRIEEGSAVLLHDVEQEAQPVVRERIHALGQGAGPPDLMQAYEALNGLLVGDGTSGYLTEDGAADAPGARLLEFPGVATGWTSRFPTTRGVPCPATRRPRRRRTPLMLRSPRSRSCREWSSGWAAS